MTLELGAGADILRTISVISWVLAIVLIALVWWLGKRWWIKLPLSVAVLVYFIHPQYQAVQRLNAEQAAWNAKFVPAKALYEQKCKTAGERIHKTVENVEGILLLKVRPLAGQSEWRDPMWLGAGLADERTGDNYIDPFLLDRRWVEWGKPNAGREFQSVLEIGGSGERGFRFVEVIDASDGQRYRYTAIVNGLKASWGAGKLDMHRELAKNPAPRYAVTFEDNVDHELRKHWVAGTTIRVIDTKSGETMAEKEVWRFDPSLGNTNQRIPWKTTPTDCPGPEKGGAATQTHVFVDKVIKAKQGK